jgi:hypothetical protein
VADVLGVFLAVVSRDGGDRITGVREELVGGFSSMHTTGTSGSYGRAWKQA